MIIESLEKKEIAPELPSAVKEEIRLILENTEKIAKTIEDNEKEIKLIAKDDPIFLEQIMFIRNAMTELKLIIKNNEQIQSLIQAHTNLNHEIGSYECYTKMPPKILSLRNKYDYENADKLLGTLKSKTSDFFNYCFDISKNFEAFKHDITHEDRHEEKKAA